MIQVNFDPNDKPTNVGESQLFESREKLSSWLTEQKVHLLQAEVVSDGGQLIYSKPDGSKGHAVIREVSEDQLQVEADEKKARDEEKARIADRKKLEDSFVEDCIAKDIPLPSGEEISVMFKEDMRKYVATKVEERQAAIDEAKAAEEAKKPALEPAKTEPAAAPAPALVAEKTEPVAEKAEEPAKTEPAAEPAKTDEAPTTEPVDQV